jgi:di/tricarboxylate transporter
MIWEVISYLAGYIMIRGRTETIESKEQRMSREEQRMRQRMIEQYYQYLTLLRLTNNF